MPNLLIIRGIPGSGKSTLAKSLLASSNDSCQLTTPNYKGIVYTHHYEADMFFINDHGIYEFNKGYIKYAHEWCFANTLKALINNHNVIVSNTFIKLWELEKYLALVELVQNTKIEVIELTDKHNSIHNVPETTIKKMEQSFEPYIKEVIND